MTWEMLAAWEIQVNINWLSSSFHVVVDGLVKNCQEEICVFFRDAQGRFDAEGLKWWDKQMTRWEIMMCQRSPGKCVTRSGALFCHILTAEKVCQTFLEHMLSSRKSYVHLTNNHFLRLIDCFWIQISVLGLAWLWWLWCESWGSCPFCEMHSVARGTAI